MKRINLHNHTKFSDGENTPKELVEKAIQSKINVLGISDHFEYFTGFFNYKSNINLYLKVLSHLKEKYVDKIKILAGLEIDLPLFVLADFPEQLKKQLDFVLFERVFVMKDVEKLIAMKKEMPFRVGLAHPSFRSFSNLQQLVNILEENNIFVELNTSCYEFSSPKDRPDLPEHPLTFETQDDFFKLLKERNVEISIGTDVHRKDDRIDDLESAFAFIKKHSLERNLIKV